MTMVFELGPALLFCPASRPERFEKAAARSDAAILDLEDAVAEADKGEARSALAAHPLDPTRTIVRLGAAVSDDRQRDLDAVNAAGYRYVMVGKAEKPADLRGLEPFGVLVQCETARGLSGLPEILAMPNVIAATWGPEDFAASLGAPSSRRADGGYIEPLRSARVQVLLHAAAAGRPAIDAVHTDIRDLTGLAREAREAAEWGFAASCCVHPDHVGPIREAYTPSAQAVARAEQIVAAAAEHGGNAFAWNGEMIDAPVVARARNVLARRYGRS